MYLYMYIRRFGIWMDDKLHRERRGGEGKEKGEGGRGKGEGGGDFFLVWLVWFCLVWFSFSFNLRSISRFIKFISRSFKFNSFNLTLSKPHTHIHISPPLSQGHYSSFIIDKIDKSCLCLCLIIFQLCSTIFQSKPPFLPLSSPSTFPSSVFLPFSFLIIHYSSSSSFFLNL